MDKAFVKTEYINSLKPQAFTSLVGLLLDMRKVPIRDEWSFTAPLIIANVLTGKEPTDSDIRNINKGFTDLSKAGFIEKYHNNSVYYRAKYSKFERRNEPYVCLDEREVRAIMNYDGDENNNNLLQYFAYLKTTFDYKTSVGMYSMMYLSEKSGKSMPTINKYHKALETAGVLKIFRFKATKMPDGNLKRQSNVYCLPGNEKAALNFLHGIGKLSKLKDETFSDQPGV